MVKILINGKYYEVKPEKNLLEVCLSLGINIPHFCYHAALGSVGACRLCAVKKYRDASDTTGKLIMSCMEPVTENLIIRTEDPEASKFQASILESLMINHPHDCPVCDEGGECHLQDMTVMTGHNYRTYSFKKRTYTNQNLGPFIHHEMNRCIQCYRCVRFYKDYAGGKDLDVFASHDNVYFGRHENGNLESEFSGNLVEVCPTGVFTDKTLKRHFTRKWDLSNAPSVCVHCSVGCNTIAGERYGVLRRIMSRYNGAVNGYFLCDKGRFGYEFVNDESRIRKIMIRSSKNENPVVSDNDQLQFALNSALTYKNKIIGIGSPRASLEANFALLKLVGDDNFYHGISKTEFDLTKTAIRILQKGPARSPSLKEIEKADSVFILGEDITQTAPMIALAVRQSARNIPVQVGKKSGIPRWHDAAQRDRTQDMRSPIFIANPYQTKLDELSQEPYHASINEIAKLGFAVAAHINSKAPTLKNLDAKQQILASEIGSALKNAKYPVIISGIRNGSIELVHAAANIAWALAMVHKNSSLCFIVPECNSTGLGMMKGKSLNEAISRIEGGKADTMIILENDLYRRTEKAVFDLAFQKCKQVIVLDHLMNETAAKADILIPVGTFAESEGTVVSNEGRAQRYYRVFPLEKLVPESWRVLGELIKTSKGQKDIPWKNFDQLANQMCDEIPEFSLIQKQMPGKNFRILNQKITRQPLRFSGRTAITANIDVSEPKLPEDNDSPLAFSMEGSNEQPPSSLVPFYWTSGWNSAQSINFYLDEPNGSMKGGDPGIRLIEADIITPVAFFEPVDESSNPKQGEHWIIPVYQIFGSEELSSQAKAVAERIPEPYLLINEKDITGSDKHESKLATVEISGKKVEVKIKIDPDIPSGIAGLSVNLRGIPYLNLPCSGKIIFASEPSINQKPETP
jgi:NADH-quinone oxidoreductase subunit G